MILGGVTTAGPNNMALLTVSTESALKEAGNFVLTVLACVHAYSTLLGNLRLKG